MKCPSCDWEGTDREYIDHLAEKHYKGKAAPWSRQSNANQLTTMPMINEAISSLLSKINLDFRPKSADEQARIRRVTMKLVEAADMAR